MSRGTILFLDDDPALQSLVSAYLGERGYEVEPALDVKQARTVLACLRVDAAIVDGPLPGAEGTDFIQELRQKYPALPILFASSFWQHLERHVLPKPYSLQELHDQVEQALARKTAPPAPEARAQDTSAGEDVDAALRELKARYGAGLGEKARALTATLERARAGSAEALEEAYQLAHKLAGTAGSYGFGAVGMAARSLEVLLKLIREEKDVADWPVLEDAMRTLATEVTRSAGTPRDS